MIFCEPLLQGALAFHNSLVPHFPPLQFGADNFSLAFSVAPFSEVVLRTVKLSLCQYVRTYTQEA